MTDHKIKIVATIGPVTNNPQSIRELVKAGMSVARLNGSHADLDWHRQTVALLRNVAPNIPILLDIPGRKIRTTGLKFEPSFQAGEIVILTTNLAHDGSEKVPVNYPNLHNDVKAGNTILADDGTLRFLVEEIQGEDIICRSLNAGQLRSRKGINVPFVKLNTPLVTERDRKMIAFAIELGVDFIGISFVESAKHIREIRNLISSTTPRILAKVENQGGIDNLDEISEEADALMIDRGDLSVETSLELLPIYQKKIINSAKESGKPIIVATEMLHSMIANDFPTKAEVVDIGNAVFDGCSATMLSGETAVGLFPIKAVEVMRSVVDSISSHIEQQIRDERLSSPLSKARGIVDAVAMILESTQVDKVVAITRSGYAARMLSARNVGQLILAVSDDPMMARSFNLFSGVRGIYFDTPFPRGSADHIKSIICFLHQENILKSDETVLVTGVIYPKTGVRMNAIQLHKVIDVIEG